MALPERDAMSLVDGGVRLVPISPTIIPTPQHVDPAGPVVDSVGQGIDERATE